MSEDNTKTKEAILCGYLLGVCDLMVAKRTHNPVLIAEVMGDITLEMHDLLGIEPNTFDALTDNDGHNELSKFSSELFNSLTMTLNSLTKKEKLKLREKMGDKYGNSY